MDEFSLFHFLTSQGNHRLALEFLRNADYRPDLDEFQRRRTTPPDWDFSTAEKFGALESVTGAIAGQLAGLDGALREHPGLTALVSSLSGTAAGEGLLNVLQGLSKAARSGAEFVRRHPGSPTAAFTTEIEGYWRLLPESLQNLLRSREVREHPGLLRRAMHEVMGGILSGSLVPLRDSEEARQEFWLASQIEFNALYQERLSRAGDPTPEDLQAAGRGIATAIRDSLQYQEAATRFVFLKYLSKEDVEDLFSSLEGRRRFVRVLTILWRKHGDLAPHPHEIQIPEPFARHFRVLEVPAENSTILLVGHTPLTPSLAGELRSFQRWVSHDFQGRLRLTDGAGRTLNPFAEPGTRDAVNLDRRWIHTLRTLLLGGVIALVRREGLGLHWVRYRLNYPIELLQDDATRPVEGGARSALVRSLSAAQLARLIRGEEVAVGGMTIRARLKIPLYLDQMSEARYQALGFDAATTPMMIPFTYLQERLQQPEAVQAVNELGESMALDRLSDDELRVLLNHRWVDRRTEVTLQVLDVLPSGVSLRATYRRREQDSRSPLVELEGRMTRQEALALLRGERPSVPLTWYDADSGVVSRRQDIEPITQDQLWELLTGRSVSHTDTRFTVQMGINLATADRAQRARLVDGEYVTISGMRLSTKPDLEPDRVIAISREPVSVVTQWTTQFPVTIVNRDTGEVLERARAKSVLEGMDREQLLALANGEEVRLDQEGVAGRYAIVDNPLSPEAWSQYWVRREVVEPALAQAFEVVRDQLASVRQGAQGLTEEALKQARELVGQQVAEGVQTGIEAAKFVRKTVLTEGFTILPDSAFYDLLSRLSGLVPGIDMTDEGVQVRLGEAAGGPQGFAATILTKALSDTEAAIKIGTLLDEFYRQRPGWSTRLPAMLEASARAELYGEPMPIEMVKESQAGTIYRRRVERGGGQAHMAAGPVVAATPDWQFAAFFYGAQQPLRTQAQRDPNKRLWLADVLAGEA
ncbi:MAG: hypothetical protein HYW10_06735, partial [Candidatus Omnitrophica bacterium]|nr:hypothetical protein [Candidatus Omnitrophota bacterium]